MTRTRGKAAATAAVLGLALSGVGTPADAGEPQVVRIRDLSTSSHAPGVGWLDGTRLHKPDGSTRSVPWGERAADKRHLRLLGGTAQGWLFKDYSDSRWNVWLLRGSTRTRLSSHGVSEGDVATIVRSGDHQRYAVSVFDGDATSYVTVHDLDGDVIASRGFDGDGAVLDFSGPEAVIGTTGTVVWSIDDPSDPGHGTVTDLGLDANGASIADDVVLARDADTGQVGPTSLSDPGPPAWTATMEKPRISPDGSRVVSRAGTGSSDLEVRRLGTGALVRSFRVRYLAAETPIWVSSRAFVFMGAAGGLGDRERLARCSLTGACAAHSVIRIRDRISVPPL